MLCGVAPRQFCRSVEDYLHLLQKGQEILFVKIQFMLDELLLSTRVGFILLSGS